MAAVHQGGGKTCLPAFRIQVGQLSSQPYFHSVSRPVCAEEKRRLKSIGKCHQYRQDDAHEDQDLQEHASGPFQDDVRCFVATGIPDQADGSGKWQQVPGNIHDKNAEN